MATRGHDVGILALLDQQGACDLFTPLRAIGVDLRELRHPRRRYFAEIGAVAAQLGPGSGTIAHTHGYHGDLVGWRAARAVGCPVIATSHGFTGGGIRNRSYEMLDRWVLRRADAVVAVSRPLEERLVRSGVSPGRAMLIRNGLDPAPALSRPEARRSLGLLSDGFIVGWIGRLSHEKGPDVLLQALPSAPDWSVAFIGSGPLGPQLKQEAVALDIAGRVQWLGAIPEAGRLLRAFDAVVVSSRTEGTPMVVLEAMAAGTPLVAAAVGGIPDLVSSAEAWLVPAEDPASIAKALGAIRSDPDRASGRAAAAHLRFRGEFGMELVLDRYENVYRRLMR